MCTIGPVRQTRQLQNRRARSWPKDEETALRSFRPPLPRPRRPWVDMQPPPQHGRQLRPQRHRSFSRSRRFVANGLEQVRQPIGPDLPDRLPSRARAEACRIDWMPSLQGGQLQPLTQLLPLILRLPFLWPHQRRHCRHHHAPQQHQENSPSPFHNPIMSLLFPRAIPTTGIYDLRFTIYERDIKQLGYCSAEKTSPAESLRRSRLCGVIGLVNWLRLRGRRPRQSDCGPARQQRGEGESLADSFANNRGTGQSMMIRIYHAVS
jgi:hypothetical protein